MVTTNETPFEIGKIHVYYEGSDVAIIATGQMVYQAIQAAEQVKSDNISVRVINCATIKPLDTETILKAAKDCGAIITVEEHQITGGLGGAVAELVSQNHPIPIKFIGVQDLFGESGEPNQLLEEFGLTTKAIVEAIHSIIKLKNK